MEVILIFSFELYGYAKYMATMVPGVSSKLIFLPFLLVSMHFNEFNLHSPY